jgi:hypothetical protein
MKTILVFLFQVLNFFGFAKSAVETGAIKGTGFISGGNNEANASLLFDIETKEPQLYRQLILQYSPMLQSSAAHYHRKAKGIGTIGGDEITFFEKGYNQSNPKIGDLGAKTTAGVTAGGAAANYPTAAANANTGRAWIKLDSSCIANYSATNVAGKNTGYNLRKEFTLSFRDLTSGTLYKVIITDIDDTNLSTGKVWFEIQCFDSGANLDTLLTDGMVLALGESAWSYGTGIPDSLIDSFEYRKFTVQTVKEAWGVDDFTNGMIYRLTDENGKEWGSLDSVRAKALFQLEKSYENMFWVGTENTNNVKTSAAKHRSGNPTAMSMSTGLYNEVFAQGGTAAYNINTGDITTEFDTINDHMSYFGFIGEKNIVNVFTSMNGINHFEDVAAAMSVDYDMTDAMVSKDSLTYELGINTSYRTMRMKGKTWLFYDMPVFDDPFGLKPVLDGVFLFYPEAKEQISRTKGGETYPMDNIYMFAREGASGAHMEVESLIKGTDRGGDVAQEFAATDGSIASCFGYAFCGMQRCFLAYNNVAVA